MAQLIHRGDPVAINWDQALFVQSAWFVIKNAPHKKEAMEFINFTNRAKNQAMNSSEIFYCPPAWKRLRHRPKVAKWMPSHPDNLKKCIELNSEYGENNKDRLTEKFEAWLMK